MNMHQVVHPISSSNGYDHHIVERDAESRFDGKFQTVKTNSSKTSFVGKLGGLESSSCDRLMYVTACLIGHQVDVHLLDGSVYSGIFHARNAENLGIVLKMAHLVKDGSGGLKNTSEPPARTLVILPGDLVQLTAKGVPVTRHELRNELQHEKLQELLTDSCISRSRHVEVGRELEHWVPDPNDPTCPELENIFDGPWNRGWDQFEVNKTLFGVNSTFHEDIYTIPLERGPHMRDLERRAELIAREIAAEETSDLHLAEGAVRSAPTAMSRDIHFGSEDCGRKSISEESPKQASVPESNRAHVQHAENTSPKVDKENQLLLDQSRASKAEDSDLTLSPKESLDKIAPSPNATAFDPPHESTKNKEKFSNSNELPEGAMPPKTQGTGSLVPPSSSTSTSSDRGGVTSTSTAQGLSSSSSSGSLSSEKSTLNPHAKEFKLNPNAKSFIPSQSSLRPLSPASDNPFYYANNVASMAQIHSMPVGMGPVMFNPHAPPMPQSYYHPNGPQYGQQVIIGQPRPYMYMHPYPAEMPYKGREY